MYLKFLLRFLGVVGLVVGSFASLLSGQTNPELADWRGVSKIRGTARVENHSWVHEGELYPHDESTIDTFVTYRFELEPKELAPGSGVPAQFAQMMRGTASSLCWVSTDCVVTGSYENAWSGDNNSNRGSGTANAHYRSALEDPQGIQFLITLKSGAWEFHTPSDLRDSYTIQRHRTMQTNDTQKGWIDDSLDSTEQKHSTETAMLSVILAGKPAEIIEHKQKDFPDTQGRPTRGASRLTRLDLWPVFEDVELVVTIDDYAKWRPLGSLKDPHTAGTRLPVQAVLKPKSSNVAVTVKPRSFTFKLLDTSREPGVCMNWPLGATDRDPDLKLVADPVFPGTVDTEGQKLEVDSSTTDKEGHYFAQAQIHSYDFGARAELRVTCRLEDGREIVGYLKAPEGDQDIISLPKGAQDGDWIALSWRKDHEVENLPDSDDSEDKPDGDHHGGDGFTLYEEYRGWMEAGKHIEGDPKKKDFFVLNERGADARGGIALFASASGLNVHSRLRSGVELSRQERRMNANHRDAPHRVDQFGVVIAKDNGTTGGSTIGAQGTDPGKAFRPHLVNLIYLESSTDGHGDGIFSIGSGVKAGLSYHDAELAWDRGVAHELLHTVGVDHHGDKLRWKRDCYFQGPNAPGNSTHQPRYVSKPQFHTWTISKLTHPFPNNDWMEDRGDTIVLRWENTGKDVFLDNLAQYQAEYERWYAQFQTEAWRKSAEADAQRTGTTTELMIEFEADSLACARVEMSRRVWVGQKNGTDSGDDFCLMRYYFATGYEINGMKNAYYLVRPGATHAGRQLCNDPKGTGNNASSHEPQSRFGDAAAGRGNCAGQVCPNDAIPPRSVQ